MYAQHIHSPLVVAEPRSQGWSASPLEKLLSFEDRGHRSEIVPLKLETRFDALSFATLTDNELSVDMRAVAESAFEPAHSKTMLPAVLVWPGGRAHRNFRCRQSWRGLNVMAQGREVEEDLDSRTLVVVALLLRFEQGVYELPSYDPSNPRGGNHIATVYLHRPSVEKVWSLGYLDSQYSGRELAPSLRGILEELAEGILGPAGRRIYIREIPAAQINTCLPADVSDRGGICFLGPCTNLLFLAICGQQKVTNGTDALKVVFEAARRLYQRRGYLDFMRALYRRRPLSELRRYIC